MKPFHTIAVPQRDVLEGRLTMDVFAADLWNVFQNRGPEEYRDAEIFFKKTFVTKGLDNLFQMVEKRIRGKGGDSVIQLQTPFGGGKTHALIGLYHKARDWKANLFVFVGDKVSPPDVIIWEELERQLTGRVKELKGKTVPSGEKIRKLLESKQPAILLIDELVEYLIPAKGMEVGSSTFDSQLLSFVKRLSEAVSSLEKCVLLVTSPSRTNYSLEDQRLLNLLSERLGRVERSYTPVEDSEISSIVRRRLFSEIDEDAARSNVSQFLEYAEKEGILPVGKELSEYRRSFLDSYPFSPEVVEVLYQRWGTFPTFQRTRGVLRLLALVIHSLKQSGRPYITLADFDLGNEEIRRELVKHIGSEFDGVIAADITNPDSGAKKVDGMLGKSFQGLMLGTRSATSIFLYSFSGGQENGANLGDIKRAATTIENLSSVVVEAVEQLKGKLFYLQSQNEKYYFLNQPNMNRILLTKMENIKEQEVSNVEKDLLRDQIVGIRFKVFPWPTKPKDITDTDELKLVILKERSESFMREILGSKGESPRVNRNTVFFLCPSDVERTTFNDSLKREISWGQIQTDKTLKLTDEQKKEASNNVKRESEGTNETLRRYYRLVYAPSRDGVHEVDLGIPTFGERHAIDEDIYERLRAQNEILEKISPLLLKTKYLQNSDSVGVVQIRDAMLKTQGERRVTNSHVLEEGIKQGVKQGLFGLGDKSENGELHCRFFREEPIVSFVDGEVLIKDSICVSQRELQREGGVERPPEGGLAPEGQTEPTGTKSPQPEIRHELAIRFSVPRGKVSQIMGIMNFLQTKFQSLELELKAENGGLTEEEYLAKVKEALQQLGVNIGD